MSSIFAGVKFPVLRAKLTACRFLNRMDDEALVTLMEEKRFNRATIHPDYRLGNETWFSLLKERGLWSAFIDNNDLDWDKNLEMDEWSYREVREAFADRNELDWIEESDYFVEVEGESPQPSWTAMVYRYKTDEFGVEKSEIVEILV